MITILISNKTRVGLDFVTIQLNWMSGCWENFVGTLDFGLGLGLWQMISISRVMLLTPSYDPIQESRRINSFANQSLMARFRFLRLKTVLMKQNMIRKDQVCWHSTLIEWMNSTYLQRWFGYTNLTVQDLGEPSNRKKNKVWKFTHSSDFIFFL